MIDMNFIKFRISEAFLTEKKKKNIETYLPKADTLAGTGKGKPRLRPLRFKCGGGG